MSAANPQPDHCGRGFVPGYMVNYRGSQKAEDRFGFGCREEISDMLDAQDNEPYPQDFSGQWEDFPRIARARMNLTALSQHYDLYFVAYRGFVHVYRLGRGVKVALREPEAILDPKESKTAMSEYVIGHINPRCPHEINHMVVGELGDQEILVVSRDNGDVNAWYTATIAEHIRTPEPARKGRMDPTKGHGRRTDDIARQPRPRHFFAENIGISAWGLAVHKKSRLIAVSSNGHEVTVFAFALNNESEAFSGASTDNVDIAPKAGEEVPKRDKDVGSAPLKCEKDRVTAQQSTGESDSPAHIVDRPGAERTEPKILASVGESPATVGETAEKIDMLQQRLQARQRTWRVVLSFGIEASNMPSIAIVDDSDGYGSRIAAIDINGYLYVADIWQIDAQLLPTDTVHAALGLHPDKTVHRAKTARGAWQDISRCMSEVRYDAASRRHKHRIAAFQSEDYSEDTDGITRDTFALADFEEITATTPRLSDKIWHPVYDPNDGTVLDKGPIRLAMTIVPYSGNHYTEFATARSLVEFAGFRGAARRAHELHVPLNINQFRQKAQQWDGEDLLRDVSFLRFNEEDAEMLALGETETGVVCHHVLDNVNTNTNDPPWDMGFGKRCSMLLTIPELHLVIAGSMCGRVALLTLTKPPHAKNAPRRGFRVDAVLPFQHEQENSERPFVCLLGIAVSPMPEPRSRGLELRRRRRVGKGGERSIEPDPPRRWRLILNYQDHTIMQYDIVKRDHGETGSWDDFAGSKVRSRRRYKARGSDTDDDSDSWDDSSEDEDITIGMDQDPHEDIVAEAVVHAMLDDLAEEELDAAFGGGGDDGEEIDFPDMQIA
ncbi:hypothetical protein J7T55_004172 [Diaporthe amygdali]|uniref:uncharacterized protein n=1 Tax=Phomopsis amygdali TaxID=1214568 RepID=UPI0022FDCC9E|nr:uncharacterized protein J7T55_004172 [Diaporthe amygdali]KAJ0116002.1 hypothetical protein J7T55_004172 [Diaporthe amygdali]